VNGVTFASPVLRPTGRDQQVAIPLPARRGALARAASALYRLQQPDGHWVGELQGDTILESEYIFLLAFLGREQEEKAIKAARYILTQELPTGGWSNYPGGPADLNVSVKAYFALKLTGVAAADSPVLARARGVIRSLGGAACCNSFTRFYLALLGQLPYRNCPAVPPELILLPRWFYINLYAMSSWTRTIVVPLTIFSAHKPCRQVPQERGIAELFLHNGERGALAPCSGRNRGLTPPARQSRFLSWSNFFLAVDWLIKKLEAFPLLHPLRRRALRKAADWLRRHFEDSDGVGAIFPPMIYTVICLRCLGVPDEAPEMRWALKQLDNLMIEENGTIRLQPCFSPVWDTALTLNALADSGSITQTHAEDVDRAVRWLLGKEVRRRGDWSETNPDLEPGGWFFEYKNGFYPDTDDTAMVLMALAKTGHANTPVARPAVERGLRWLMAMQNSDGGWAAFDRDINREVLTKVPFADHNAMLDPSCPDITARVLEALGHHGYGVDHPQVERALRFIEQTQDPRGCWPGRWGVNYLYGTWQVLCGLQSIGYDMSRPAVRRAVRWLESVQQLGGCWGESCASYNDPGLAGQGEPTASQTAWALLALLAAGEHHSSCVRAGIRWLEETQKPDGTWDEELFTGTGFPKVFYLKYHLYALYFPLMALGRYHGAISAR
jgi:squalene-hopene/tetraprenyl-beta-curcumene cyclase